MGDYVPDDPETEEVVLEFPKHGIVLSKFIEYSFESNFLTASDAFHFTFAADRITDELRTAMRPGSEVLLRLQGAVQACGIIMASEAGASRESGAEWRLEGRDKLGLAVDAGADPTLTFKPKATLLDALKGIFGPYGWSTDEHFEADGLADRSVRQDVQGKRVVARKSKKPRKKLSNYELHQLKAKPGEGIFDFAKRIAVRQGLWIWPSADGKKLIVDRPDFETPPAQKLYRNVDGTTNVKDGAVRLDITDQPTIIIADGFSGGGDFTPRNPIQGYVVNNAVYTDDTTFVDLPKRFPGARYVKTHNFPLPLYVPRHRLLFCHDNDAQTLLQLEYFLRRTLAEYQRRSFTARYTVEGHGQSTPNGFYIWDTNTLVDVHDEIGYVNEPLYLIGRGLRKARQGGTTTSLDLIRPYTIDLGGDPSQAPAEPSGDF